MSDLGQLRLGHAHRGKKGTPIVDELKQAIEIAIDTLKLEAREPLEPGAVDGAETLMGCAGPPRPIYAYVGDLHPGLGSIGFIFDRSWAIRCASGLSRCDSGGLHDGIKGFSHAGVATERHAILKALSTEDTCPLGEWETHFAAEVSKEFGGGVKDYVDGKVPTLSGDPRGNWIAEEMKTTPRPDRRLWTWEARMKTPPLSIELKAVILSPQAATAYDMDLISTGATFPKALRMHKETISTAGSGFQSPETRAALRGEWP